MRESELGNCHEHVFAPPRHLRVSLGTYFFIGSGYHGARPRQRLRKGASRLRGSDLKTDISTFQTSTSKLLTEPPGICHATPSTIRVL